MSSSSHRKRRWDSVSPSPRAGPAALSEHAETAHRTKRIPPTRPTSRNDFGVAIICALTHEVDAVNALLDEKWDGYGKHARDDCVYTCGRIGRHNVVVTYFLGMGKVNAAHVANSCKLSFPHVKLALVVGVCAGAPFVSDGLGHRTEIILGDVVVSQGVVQYDFGRQTDVGLSAKVTPLEALSRPVPKIASHLAMLKSRDGRKRLLQDMSEYLAVLQGDPELEAGYVGVDQDWLFESDYPHQYPSHKCEDLCDRTKLVPRGRLRGPNPPTPEVHFGLIASGDAVMKSAVHRDKIIEDHNVVAFEMESAGVWDVIPCMVIKGVCDYADSHKAKSWQRRAAAAAAACMKAFLRDWAPFLPGDHPPGRRQSPGEFIPSGGSSPEPSIIGNWRQDTSLSSEICSRREECPASQAIDTRLKQSLVDRLFFAKIDERLTNLTAAQGKTCLWFLAKPEYTAWNNMTQQSGDSGFLWIKGNPGTGKSTLMKLLFEEARKSARGDPSQITLSFFFLARGALEERSTEGLYRSLLHQLSEVVDLKDSLEWMTAPGARIILQNGWHEEALKQTLTHAISRLGSRSLAIFVDALDECDQSQVRSMVCFFEELCEHAKEADVELRICFSSRHYPTVVIERGVEVTLEDESGHTDDIERYIKSKLRLGKNNKHAATLRAEILQKSSGIFLWVALVLDILGREFPVNSAPISKIRNRLEQIPPGLHDLFEMILARDTKDLEQLHVCLKWVLFAARPLKPQELYFAVELGLDSTRSGYWDHEDVEEDQMKTFVRTSSKGLAEVTRNKSSEVQFIHESVRDFLLGRYGKQWSEASGNFEGHCHNFLRDCCFAQLNAPIRQSVAIPDPLPREAEVAARVKENLHQKFPFLEYSISGVLHHSNSAQQHGQEQGDHIRDFPLPQWVALNNAFERHLIRRYTKSVDLFYILAEKNLADLIRIYPQPQPCFSVGQERYGPPMFAALATGSHDAVQAMFNNIQARAQNFDPPLPDLRALYHQNEVKKAGFDRSFKFSRHGGISQYIHREGGEMIAHAYLLSEPSKTDLPDNNLRTLLSWAVEHGHETVVKLLLAAGAIVDSKDYFGQPPLSLAVKRGYEAIVKLLLAAGAIVNSKDDFGQTPLSLAAEHGHEAIVKLLLAAGAIVDSKDNFGQTPLSLAAKRGHEAIVKLLLAAGAIVDSKDNDGQTPLLLAAEHGYEAIVNLLTNYQATPS